jgi:hypothetical protein
MFKQFLSTSSTSTSRIIRSLITRTSFSTKSQHAIETTECKRIGIHYAHITYKNDITSAVKIFDNYKRLILDCKCEDGVLVEQKIFSKFGECLNLPEGEIFVWKACKHAEIPVYVQLRVPDEAERITPFYQDLLYQLQYPLDHAHRGRVEYGYVEDIIGLDGTEYDTASSSYCSPALKLTYKKGRLVTPDKHDNRPHVFDSHGIHVCLRREDCKFWFERTENSNSL